MFPVIIGVLLFLVGAAITIHSILSATEAELPRFQLAAIVPVTVSILIFVFGINRIGLALTAAILFFIANLSINLPKILVVVIAALVFSVVAVLIFPVGLGLPYRIFPWR